MNAKWSINSTFSSSSLGKELNLKNFTKRIICNGYILWNQNQINLNVFFKHMTSYVIYIVFIFFGLEKTLTLRNWHPFSLWPSCVYCNTKYYIYFDSLHIASFLHKERFLFPLKFRQSNPPTQFQPSPKTNKKQNVP